MKPLDIYELEILGMECDIKRHERDIINFENIIISRKEQIELLNKKIKLKKDFLAEVVK